MKNVTTLNSDPRYTAARDRYTALQTELTGLANQLNGAYSDASILAQPQDLIRDEASAMLEGAPPPPAANRAAIIKTIDDLNHRIAVLRQAVAMQRDILEKLTCEIGATIARECLPQHKANIAAIIDAALTLAAALQAEKELRDSMTENNIVFSSVIRAMPIPGFDLRDDQSRLSRYLLECHEYGYCKAGNLPDIVRDRIPPKAKRTHLPATAAAIGDAWADSNVEWQAA